MWPFGLFGSLAAWELRRIARRGLATRVRLILLYTLLLAFLAFATFWFQHLSARDVFFGRPGVLAPAELARFANFFALTLLEAQLVAVVALAPALAASSVSEEKYRQTLPLLLITLLTDREIVFGKAVGRIAFLLAALFAGLPVLMITQFFGGVSPAFLAAAYAVTTGTVVLCAAIGVSAACYAPDLRSAVLRAYTRIALFVCGAFVPPFVLASPFVVLAMLAGEPMTETQFLALALGYPLLQVLVGSLFLINAVRALRLRDATAGPPPATAYPEPPKPAEPPLLQPEDEVPPDLPPIDAGDPVLWKERCVGWRPKWAPLVLSKFMGFVAGAVAIGLFACGMWIFLARVAKGFDPSEIERYPGQPSGLETGGWLLVAAGVFAGGRYLLPLAVGLSGAIAGERFRGTLDVLLTTTLDRRAVLRAKVQAQGERGTVFGAVAVAAVGTAFIADAGIRVGLAAAGLTAVAMALVVAVGAWLTVRCSSDARAFRLLLPVTMLVVGWPVFVWNLLRGETPVPPQILFWGLVGAACVCSVAGLVFWIHATHVLSRGE
ncbi:ABC transporter permease protein OS=Bacillus sp. TS-2 GN=BTS2_3566 PE=4 SV=1 [Gemmata massiliana]|uniref:ABC transporter permease protein n=1 Tax=Gemmata massiliana TaxID=1210884 RepID=A0A6P2D2T8_9BACT|nr:ABC transporter permease subunit [Gemmata massiliana]VTR95611.1 ABC transporter permease protein OS=Bacillus sp. TS-2 GN=BTS2_3566 PE=4 SV=1 [Gemmata massiliana]